MKNLTWNWLKFKWFMIKDEVVILMLILAFWFPITNALCIFALCEVFYTSMYRKMWDTCVFWSTVPEIYTYLWFWYVFHLTMPFLWSTMAKASVIVQDKHWWSPHPLLAFHKQRILLLCNMKITCYILHVIHMYSEGNLKNTCFCFRPHILNLQ